MLWSKYSYFPFSIEPDTQCSDGEADDGSLSLRYSDYDDDNDYASMATNNNELVKGGKGNEKGLGQEKVGMATDSDRLEEAKHWGGDGR